MSDDELRAELEAVLQASSRTLAAIDRMLPEVLVKLDGIERRIETIELEQQWR